MIWPSKYPLVVFAACLYLLTAAACKTREQKAADFIQRGKSFFEKKDYARAAIEFKNAATATPLDAEPAYQLGITYLKLGSLRPAASSLKKATELNPKHARAQIALADLMAGNRNPAVTREAERHAEQALSADPENIDAINVLARAELDLGQIDEAERHLKAALTKFPSNLRSSVTLTALKLRQKDVRGAEDVLKTAAERAPKSAPVATALGEFYLLFGRAQDAEAQLRRAHDLDPRDPRAALGFAMAQRRNNKMADAEATFKQLSGLPDSPYQTLYAQFLFEQGRRDAAMAELRRLHTAAPKDRAMRDRLIAALLATNQPGEANQIISAALKANPKDVDALLKRSTIYLSSGKLGEAEEDLHTVLRYRPDSSEAHYVLAALRRESGDLMFERQELTEAVRLAPSLLVARLALAQNFMNKNAAKSALDVLERAPDRQKQTIKWTIYHNWALLVNGDEAKVKESLETVSNLSNTLDLLLQDGLVKAREGNHAAAQAAFDQALKLRPDDVRALEMSLSYAAEHQPAAAKTALQQHLARTPQSASLQHFAGGWLLRNHDRAAARRAFDVAKALDPSFIAVDLALAEMDIEDKKFEPARLRLAALLKAPNARRYQILSARVLLGGLEMQSGNPEEAIHHYRAVVAENPQNTLVLNNLAYLLLEHANQPDEALKYAQQAKELSPDRADISDTLGWILYRKGTYDQAVRHLQDAATKDRSAVYKYHLGIACWKAGNREHAREVLAAALRQDPNLPEARMALEALRGQ
jgi:tetratricopeptide (TPR) repeat protein